MNRSIIVGIIVLLAGLAVGWFVLQGAPGQGEQNPEPSQAPEALISPGPDGVDVPDQESAGVGQVMEKGGIAVSSTPAAAQTAPVATSTVGYTDNGFVPNTVTVLVGTTVQFANQSSTGMWVASAVHPTHQLLPGFDQLQSVARGGVYDYTFTKVGTWKYHNHVNATDTGTVVVTGAQ